MENLIVKREYSVGIFDKILNMAETKIGLFQVKTEVDYPVRVSRVSTIETRTVTVCSLPVGKYKIGKTFP